MVTVNLPEKAYFTLEESAKHWDCAPERVLHYIHEGLLRPAIESKLLEDLMKLDLKAATNVEGGSFASRLWKQGETTAIYRINTEQLHQFGHLPRFVYFNGRDVISNNKRGFVTVIETFDSTEYGLTDYDIFSNETTCTPYLFEVTSFYSAPVITLEERDRFESEHGLSTGRTTEPGSYTTPHLEILQEAISQFFTPRRDPDPKKLEVVEWIKSRLLERGMDPSDNISEAIFTIIKPPDHNPRRRRG